MSGVRRAAFFALICIGTHALAWGPEGHRIIADVARQHLTETTRRHIRELLGNDDLAAISTWADEVRGDRPETFGWHFVDIPANSSGFSDQRDCYRPDAKHPSSMMDHDNCVVDRIKIFRRILADKTESDAARIEALKFLVHLVADIHQPLHAIAEARGGNDIHVTQFGATHCANGPCSLHFAWDTGLIEHSGLSQQEYVAGLGKRVSRRRLLHGAEGTPEDWANQSFHLAQRVWRRDGGVIDEAYFQNNIEVLNEQLALAGLRLANMLNQALGN